MLRVNLYIKRLLTPVSLSSGGNDSGGGSAFDPQYSDRSWTTWRTLAPSLASSQSPSRSRSHTSQLN